jgi:hypothetical protein
MAILSRLAFPETSRRGEASFGLLMLRRPEERPEDSALLTALREVSRSLKALTVTGATEAVAAVGIEAFAILGIVCPLAVVDLEAVMVVAVDFDCGGTCEEPSPMPRPDVEFPDVCTSEAICDASVEFVTALSPRDKGLEGGFHPVAAVLELLLDAVSWKSPSSPS